MEYTVKTINELCTKITDGSHFSPEHDTSGIYPMYSVKDMDYNNFLNKDCKMIGQEVFEKLSKADCRPLKNDILIAKDGSYLKCVFKATEDLNACILSSIAILRPNLNAIDPDYFVYLMRTQSIKGAMANYVSGSALPRIILSDFKKMKLKMISDLPTQRRIASILSTYDALIQNYKRQIAALQSAASELYKEWFVRFRFPGYKNAKFKNSRIGRIPINFDVKKQNEVINKYIGGGWGEDEQSESFSIEAAVVRGADFPEFTNGNISTCPIRYHKASNYNARVIEPNDIILEVSGGTQEQPVGRTVIVTKDRLERFNNKLICASFCKLIKLNKSVITPFFYFYWMQFVYDTRIITRYQLQSTGIINFKFEYFLRKGDVLIPTKELMETFDSKVQLIHTQIEKLAIAITNLTTQRDLLLPRLMSGKLSVE